MIHKGKILSVINPKCNISTKYPNNRQYIREIPHTAQFQPINYRDMVNFYVA